MNITLQQHLDNVLSTHRMAHVDDLLSKYNKKRDEIKEALEGKYTDRIYNPFNSGSYAKHTAINIKFDLDIVVPFKRDSFGTLEVMYDDVYEFLKEKYKGIAEVRKQKVSIGVLFPADKDGDVINIDIVPGRETQVNDYLSSRNLNLFFNEGIGNYTPNTYLKTNIHSQIDHIKGKDAERKIIRLLKIWKISNGKKYKSFFLELITIKAFNQENISGNLWEMLKAVLNYIKDNVSKDGFTLVDPGNSNNIVSDSLTQYEKTILASEVEFILDNIARNDDNIKGYFPTNEDFESTLAKESYGLKSTVVGPSIPSNNNRFG